MRIESVFSLASAVESDTDAGYNQERQRSDVPDTVADTKGVNTVAAQNTDDVANVGSQNTDDVANVGSQNTDDVANVGTQNTDDVVNVGSHNTYDVTTVAMHNTADITNTQTVSRVSNIDTTSDRNDALSPTDDMLNIPPEMPSSPEGTLACPSNTWLSPEKTVPNLSLPIEPLDDMCSPDTAPPDLQQEDGIQNNIEYNYTLDSIPPPVLMPEIITIPSKEVCEPEKKVSPKIHPSYIVLTDITPEVEQISKSGSYSLNKLHLKECSNMCKKMNFRKGLNAGKDVFNVKVPSKQKAYEVYMKEMNSPTCDVTKLMKITNEKYNKTKKQRKRGSKKRVVSRVRRNILSIPKDFKMDNVIDVTDNVEVEETICGPLDHIPVDVVEKEFLRRKFKLELKTLKELIMVKREANKRLHRIKKAKVYNNVKDPLIKVAGSKSFSGRIRKSNVRLSGFATNKFDEDTCVVQRNTLARLNSMKRKRPSTQDIRDHIVKKLRVGNPPPTPPSTSPPPDVEPESDDDSVEEEKDERCVQFGKFTVKGNDLIETPLFLGSGVSKTSKVGTKKRKRSDRKRNNKKKPKFKRENISKKIRDALIEATEHSINKVRNKLKSTEIKGKDFIQNIPVDKNLEGKVKKSKSLSGKKSKAASLASIRNMPVDNNLEEQLITLPMYSGSKNNATSTSTIKGFPVAVSLLSKKENPLAFNEHKYEFQAPEFSSDPTLLSEKYKALRIPENVQRLFSRSSYTNIIMSNTSLATNSSTPGMSLTTSSLSSSSKTNVSPALDSLKQPLTPNQEEPVKITIPIKNIYTGPSKEPLKLYIPQKELLALTKSFVSQKSTTLQPQCSTPQSTECSTTLSTRCITPQLAQCSMPQSTECSTLQPTQCSTTLSTRCSTPQSTQCSTTLSTQCSTPQSTQCTTPLSTRCSTPQSTRCSTLQSTLCSTPQSTQCSTLQSTQCSTILSTQCSTTLSTQCSTPQSTQCSTPQSPQCSTPQSTQCSTLQSTQCSTPQPTQCSTLQSMLQSTQCSTPQSTQCSTPQSPQCSTPQPTQCTLQSMLQSTQCSTPQSTQCSTTLSTQCSTAQLAQCSNPQLSDMIQPTGETVANYLGRKSAEKFVANVQNNSNSSSKSHEPPKIIHTPTTSAKHAVRVGVSKVSNTITHINVPTVSATTVSAATVSAITVTPSSIVTDPPPLSKPVPVTMHSKIVTVYPIVSSATSISPHSKTTSAMISKPALQVPITTPVPSAKNGPQETTQKSKFYLLKVEGTNFLIPIDSNTVAPLMVRKTQLITSTTTSPSVARSTSGNIATLSPSKVSPVIVSAATVSNFNLKSITPTSSVRLRAPVPDLKKPTVLTSTIKSRDAKPMTSPLINSQKSIPVVNVQKITRTLPENQVTDNATQSLLARLPITRIKVEKEDPGYAKAEGKVNIGNQNVSQRNAELRKLSELTRHNKSTGVSRRENEPESTRETTQDRYKLACVQTNEMSPVENASLSSKMDGQREDSVKSPNDKPQAFVDSMTTREERLRRLKEKLKQNQKAVEELRSSILKH